MVSARRAEQSASFLSIYPLYLFHFDYSRGLYFWRSRHVGAIGAHRRSQLASVDLRESIIYTLLSLGRTLSLSLSMRMRIFLNPVADI